MKQMLSLSELAAELERQAAAKVDYLAPTDKMHFVTASGDHTGIPAGQSELDLVGVDVTGLVLNEVAHHQLGEHLGIPRRYYDRLRGELPGLLDLNVNKLLHHKPSPRMVRTLDGTARAFLSDSYRRRDNDELARAVLPVLGAIPEVKIRSCAVTDKRMYIKATTPRLTAEVKVGQEVCAGVYVGNSEVGYGSLVVYPFIETLACTNGMVVQRAGEGMMRQVHLGRRVEADNTGRVFRDETLAADDKAFFMAVGDVVRAAVDEVRFRELVASMADAANDEPVRDVQAAVEVLAKRETLLESEAHDVLQHLAEGGDLSRWGVISAVTRTAEDRESYDRATELEALGGKLLSYTRRDWRELVTA